MTTNPESPADLSMLTKPPVPDTLTLISLIREDISAAISPLLSRADDKAYVLMTLVSNGGGFFAVARDKAGEYRELEFELRTMYMLDFKEQQYLDQKNYKGEHLQTGEDKGAWFSVLFTVENDGFISKTTYNYDKPVFTGSTPEEWMTAPEVPSEERHPIWTKEQYLEDIEQFPRESALPEWLN